MEPLREKMKSRGKTAKEREWERECVCVRESEHEQLEAEWRRTRLRDI